MKGARKTKRSKESKIEEGKGGGGLIKLGKRKALMSLVFLYICTRPPSLQPSLSPLPSLPPSPLPLFYYYRHPSLSPSNSCLASLAVRSVSSFAMGLMTWCLIFKK